MWYRREKTQHVRVFIRTRCVAVRSFIIDVPVWSPAGRATTRKWSVEYEYQLDKVQKLMIQDATDLALSAGLRVRITDISKLNVLERTILSVFKRLPDAPIIFVPDVVFSRVLANRGFNDSIFDLKWIASIKRLA